MLGREIVSLVNENLSAGYHSITWDSKDHSGKPVSAGIYFYQLQANQFVKTRKMVLLK
jgi:flagellar hook assembly protein FlgD